MSDEKDLGKILDIRSPDGKSIISPDGKWEVTGTAGEVHDLHEFLKGEEEINGIKFWYRYHPSDKTWISFEIERKGDRVIIRLGGASTDKES